MSLWRMNAVRSEDHNGCRGNQPEQRTCVEHVGCREPWNEGTVFGNQAESHDEMRQG